VWRLVFLPAPFLALAAWVWPRFDGLYGQDAFAYYDYALGPLREALMRGEGPPPFFWPPGYPLLVALSSFLVGARPLAGQVVSLLAGMVVPVFTALFARAIWPGEERGWGWTWLAGLLAAFMSQLWQSSVVVMADATALAAATVGMWALAEYGRRERMAKGMLWLVLAAAAMGFAVLTRWAYALVAIPATMYAMAVLWRLPRPRAFVHALLAAAAVALVLWPLWGPIFSLLLLNNETSAAFVGDLRVYSWHPLNAFRREFTTADGLLRYRFANGVYYLLAPLHRFYFTLLAAPFLLLGAWRAARMRSLAWALLVLGWAAAILLFHAGAPWQNFRFTLAALPPLALLVALGAQSVHERWRLLRLGPRHDGIKHLLLVTYLVFMLALMAWGGARLTQSFIERKENDLATVAWVESRVPERARLLTFGLTATFQHYSDLEAIELFYLDPKTLAGLLEEGKPVFVFVDEDVLAGQWRGRPPEANVRWLHERAGLMRLGETGGYTLFAVDH